MNTAIRKLCQTVAALSADLFTNPKYAEFYQRCQNERGMGFPEICNMVTDVADDFIKADKLLNIEYDWILAVEQVANKIIDGYLESTLSPLNDCIDAITKNSN